MALSRGPFRHKKPSRYSPRYNNYNHRGKLWNNKLYLDYELSDRIPPGTAHKTNPNGPLTKQDRGLTSFQQKEQRLRRLWHMDRMVAEVMRLWLEGKSLTAITGETGIQSHDVINALELARTELKQATIAEAAELQAERIEGFRDIKRRALEGIDVTPRQKASLLTVALRAEENIARLQGISPERVIADIGPGLQKLYGFTDNYPTVEGEVRELGPGESVKAEELIRPAEIKPGMQDVLERFRRSKDVS